MIELGSKVKSKINGFTGIMTSRAVHLNGCTRCWIEPPLDKDGKLQSGSWFDEVELVLVEETKTELTNQDRGGFPSRSK